MKLNDTYKQHIPARIVSEIESGESVYTYEAVRMTRGVCKLTHDFGSEYYYRGREIHLNESVPTGYYGRWRVGGVNHGRSSDTMESCKHYIDSQLAAKAQET